ncbi:MAG: hypothetical protein E2O39_11520 [Planctomycetota bacterium]|nr:MAG: hypothetical protein E2O39_11520 [Planctomycetota bacterium]
MMNATITCLALALAPLQQDPAGARQREGRQPELPTVSQLVMRNYQPTSADPLELFDTIKAFAGQAVSVRDTNTLQIATHENLQLFGNTILVYDLLENADRIMVMMAELNSRAAEEAMMDALLVKEERAGIELFEYRRRYVSLYSLVQALQPLQRNQPDTHRDNMTFVEGQGSIVVRDTPDRVREIKELIARIDVPTQQVLFTCYLVNGAQAESADGLTLPKELVSGMRELVGYPHLKPLAFAMLRSTASTDDRLLLELQASPVSYSLMIHPSAYDAETGSVTLARCSFVQKSAVGEELLFETTTMIHAGEYTVLGATGMAPVFVVLHCKILDR